MANQVAEPTAPRRLSLKRGSWLGGVAAVPASLFFNFCAAWMGTDVLTVISFLSLSRPWRPLFVRGESLFHTEHFGSARH